MSDNSTTNDMPDTRGLTLREMQEIDSKYFFNVFSRTPVAFLRGDGTELIGTDGKVYLDFLGGIAVNALGHRNPAITAAIHSQAERFIHCSNLYYIEEQAKLAKTIVDISCADRVFFCGSGAEANEAALKLAKMYHYKAGNEEKYKFVTAQNSFHGRTLATVAATGQPKYQKPYEPLLPWFSHVRFNDFDALDAAVSEKETAAVMLELVQGESGVHVAELEYVRCVAKLCKERGVLLIVDEVQTGLGRTGKLFAYEHYDIEPDIFTLAKALGAGFPIGAMLAKESVASAFTLGDHGSTFGGNPLACAVGNASVGYILSENLPEKARQKGIAFKEKLLELAESQPLIKEVRGMGLMIGVELSEPKAIEVKNKLLTAGCIVGSVGDSVLRMLPPLTVKNDEIERAVTMIKEAL